MTKAERFSFNYYFCTLTRILREPGRFFTDLENLNDFTKPAFFLLVSTLFFTAGSYLVSVPSEPLKTISVCIVNSLGMVIIASVLCYITMITIFGRRIQFSGLFCIFSLASGVTLLTSWVPNFIWFTEIWKWWLVGVGLVTGGGFRWYQALLIISVTVLIMVALFLALFSTVF